MTLNGPTRAEMMRALESAELVLMLQPDGNATMYNNQIGEEAIPDILRQVADNLDLLKQGRPCGHCGSIYTGGGACENVNCCEYGRLQ